MLIDGSALAKMIAQTKGPQPAAMPGQTPADVPADVPAAVLAATPATDTLPPAPAVAARWCAARRADKPFWGCVSYPKCRGIRAIG